jgi:hypothetical protein
LAPEFIAGELVEHESGVSDADLYRFGDRRLTADFDPAAWELHLGCLVGVVGRDNYVAAAGQVRHQPGAQFAVVSVSG